jgi:5-formyltetrahydrofolate cyclo-ligase
VIPVDKISLRQHIRQQRRQLSRARQSRAAQQVCLRIMRTPWWRSAKYIAFYWPADGELSLLPLLRWSLRRGKHCYLPLVRGKELEFRRFQPGQTLRRNRYGIPEPTGTQAWAAQQLDVILLPLVAFDEHCNRLGMGAGFYDRALAATGDSSPLRIGVAYQLQKFPQLPIDPWDVPLHAVVTEYRTYERR